MACAHADHAAAWYVDPVAALCPPSAAAAQAVACSAVAKMVVPQCSHAASLHLPAVMMSACGLHLLARLAELATALAHMACALMQVAHRVSAAHTGIGADPLTERQHQGIAHSLFLRAEAVTVSACFVHAGEDESHAGRAAHADGSVTLLAGTLKQACAGLRVPFEHGKRPRHAVHAVALPGHAVVASPVAGLTGAAPAVLGADCAHADEAVAALAGAVKVLAHCACAEAVHADSVRASAHTGHGHAEAVRADSVRASAHTGHAAALPADTVAAWTHPDHIQANLVHLAAVHAGCNHAGALPGSHAKACAHTKLAPADTLDAHSHAEDRAAVFAQGILKVPAQTAHGATDPADAVAQDGQTGTDPAVGHEHTHPGIAQAADTATHAGHTVGTVARPDRIEAVPVGTWESLPRLGAQDAI